MTAPSPFPMYLDGQAAAKASLQLKMLLLKGLLNICLLLDSVASSQKAKSSMSLLSDVNVLFKHCVPDVYA